MASRRCTVHPNNQNGDGKIIMIGANMSLDAFLRAASEKLGIRGKRLFLEDGGEIDDINSIRDNDVVYLSAGEPFAKKGGKGNAKGGQACPLYSIAVMGPGSVGKSALTLQYVQGVFVHDYDPTIEDAYRKNTQVDGEPCLLDILDTAGQEDYTALRSTWMRERDGFLLVFSITDHQTFDDLGSFYDQLSVMHEDRVPPILLVGNKCDLVNERHVSEVEGRERAKQYGAVAYIETSAKTGANIEKSFGLLVKTMRDKNRVKDAPAKNPKKGFSWKCIML